MGERFRRNVGQGERQRNASLQRAARPSEGQIQSESGAATETQTIAADSGGTAAAGHPIPFSRRAVRLAIATPPTDQGQTRQEEFLHLVLRRSGLLFHSFLVLFRFFFS